MPQLTQPEAYGLHENADITKSLGESTEFLSSLTKTHGRIAIATEDEKQKAVLNHAKQYLKDLVQPFDMDSVREHFAVDYAQSMNVLLLQELQKFNNLINFIQDSLKEIIGVIEGEILLTDKLKNVIDQVYQNKIPLIWRRLSFDSVKPLGSYMRELGSRVDFFKEWVEKGLPQVFLISKFYFA